MLRRVALVRTDVSEEGNASFIRVTRIGVLGTKLASVVRSSPILVTLMKEALSSPKRRFLQEPHSVTSQKTPFFIILDLYKHRSHKINIYFFFKSYIVIMDGV
jgi:hypothetical protein